jgi:hypothetical protein
LKKKKNKKVKVVTQNICVRIRDDLTRAELKTTNINNNAGFTSVLGCK